MIVRHNVYRNNLADLGLLYIAVIWGSTFFVVKDSLAYVDPVLLVGYRFIVAALLMGCFLIYRRKPWLTVEELKAVIQSRELDPNGRSS